MKALVISLIKRNAIVALAFSVLLTGLRLACCGYAPLWILTWIVFFCGLRWVNGVLSQQGRQASATLLSLLLVPILGFPVVVASFRVSERLVGWKYNAQGLRLVEGCNAAAANMARFDLFDLDARLTKLKDSPGGDSNQIVRLQAAYSVAQEKFRILSDDCSRRGHRDNHPWKTDWGTIRQAFAASEQGLHQ